MTNRENKRSLRQKIQDFMSTPKGQTIMNYAYNWGASVVIMGTLFKLTHLPGANFMLFAGMGTEVLIFFLSAFDLSGVKRDGTNAGASVSLGGNIQAGNIVSGDAVADNTEFSGMSSADDVPAGNRIAGGGPSIVVVQGGSAMQAGTPIQTGSQNISPMPAGQPVQPIQPVQTVQPAPAESTYLFRYVQCRTPERPPETDSGICKCIYPDWSVSGRSRPASAPPY